ncbi:hypothetical protein D3C71_242570 [compost metagenome]
MTDESAGILCHQRDAQLATLAQCIDDVVFGVAAVSRHGEGGAGQRVYADDVVWRFTADGVAQRAQRARASRL